MNLLVVQISITKVTQIVPVPADYSRNPYIYKSLHKFLNILYSVQHLCRAFSQNVSLLNINCAIDNHCHLLQFHQ